MNKTKVPDIPKSKPTKREQVRAAKKRRSFMWNAIVLGTLGVFALVIAAFVFANQRPGPIPGEEVIPVEGSGTIEDGRTTTYINYPPSSGNHYALPAPWQVFTDTLVPEERFVSNLAAGGVVFLYECEPTTCATLEQQFADLYKKAPPDPVSGKDRKILVSRYGRDLAAPIVALAWGHQLEAQQFDEALFLQWYRRFLNQVSNP